jgi:signal transduction histidine kinase
MSDLFNINRFMPHGHSFQWDPGILWTSVISDALIFAAYTAIPFTLVFQIMRKRKDLPFNWMFVCFGLFIIACGLSHLMAIVTMWKPYYLIEAVVKAITAAASVPTAIILYRIAPKIVQLPTLRQLVHEQSLRLKAEAESEAKDKFVAVLSHELRTPLTPVTAGLDLLEDELKSDNGGSVSPSVLEALQMVRRNVAMETTLINDLLDVSGARHGKLDLELGLVDLEEVVRQSIPLFQNEIDHKHIDFELKVLTDRTIVIGAKIRLHQVVNNLVSNAIKFTPDRGRIVVKLNGNSRTIRLSVQDNGRGIDPNSLVKIFQPFEQGDWDTARSRTGLGLGLTIARTIAESHHGTLTAHSAGAGQGAIFIFELPLAEQQRRSKVPPATEVRVDVNGPIKPRILLVEDHIDTLRALASLLRKAGYPVETAENVRQAEPLLANAEVLLSDIGLPDGSGCDLMLRFKERGGTHGIAITGFGQEEDIAGTKRAGFSKHMIKPVDFDSLKAALQEFEVGRFPS